MKAKLVRKITADKLAAVKDDIQLGQVYVVDVDTIRPAVFFNQESNVFHEKLIISTDDGSWFYAELLDLKQMRGN